MIDPAVCRWINAAGLSVKPSYRIDEYARLVGRSRSAAYDHVRRGVVCATTDKPRRIPIAALAVLFETT